MRSEFAGEGARATLVGGPSALLARWNEKGGGAAIGTFGCLLSWTVGYVRVILLTWFELGVII